MTPSSRAFSSDYMHWAKTRQAARFNLGNSGLFNFPLADLPVRIEDLELSGPSFYGWPPLQAALARFLHVPEECLVQATGVSMANHLVMAATIEAGDEVLIERPTYELLVSTARYLGADVRRFRRPRELGFRLDPDELDRALTPRTKLVVLTNLHNPSSALIDKATMRQAAAVAQKVGATLLVDEVYLDAAFLDEPRATDDGRRTTNTKQISPSATHTAFGLAENIVVTSSLTKVYGLSGLRCGWILAPPPLAEKLWRLNDLFGVIPAHAAERLSLFVLQHFDRVADRARALLSTNRTLFNNFLAARTDLECEPLRVGTVAFPRVLRGDVEQLCAVLRDRYETSVVPGHFFEMPDHFRLGIGRSTEDTAEGLWRLGAALDEA